MSTSAGWYADPYGEAAAVQRWYDGTKWTDKVRVAAPQTATGGQTQIASLGPRPDAVAPEHGAVATESYEPEFLDPPADADFPMRMSEAIGEKLRLVNTSARHNLSHELRCTEGRVASVRLFGRHGLATVRCAEGAWSLTKHRGSWELLIQETDGDQVGWYSGRRWLPGGTIVVRRGTELELLRSVAGGWKLRRAGQDTVAAIRPGNRLDDLTAELTIRSLPGHLPDYPLMILVALAVVTLGQSLPRVPSISSQSPVTAPDGADPGRGTAQVSA